ncbi:CBASS cGAMP synthase [Hymenobacter ruber]
MANCDSIFKVFDEAIILNDSRHDSLKRSRKALRTRIKEYFKNNKPGELKPKFHGQGSFMMGVAINPIPKVVIEDEKEVTKYKYDVDDGVYFIGKESDRKAITTYHNWIWDAVDGHTDTAPVDKNTCIRVIYHDGHNIDLPIYFLLKGDDDAVPQLAHKAKSWIDSDPREFVTWFTDQADEQPQLRSLVRYLKAWCDYQNDRSGTRKMPIGLVMTIWATENARYNERDDVALRDTLQAIRDTLRTAFECNRPTVPAGENLLDDYNHEDYFIGKLDAFLESAKQAVNETNQKVACGKWQTHLGSRFPCRLAEDKDVGARAFGSPAVITENAKSA